MSRAPESSVRARLRRFMETVGPAFGLLDEAGAAVPADGHASRRHDAHVHRRQQTLAAIAVQARRSLDGRIAEGAVSQMWLDRFMTLAADAHDPAVRTIYARMLAAEALRPGSVAPRSLWLLATLDAAELRRFQKLAQFAIGNFVLRLKDGFFEGYGVDAEDLFHFEEIGLLRTGGSNVKNFPSQLEDRFQTHLLHGDRVLRVTADDPTRRLVIPCYRLTTAGADIAEAMALPVINEYITQIVGTLEKRGYAVSHASILERGDRNTVTRHSRFSEIVSYDRARAARRRQR
ncbi:MAG: DUF2806 domain-containing protein [Alphaproteobacteria bacterium]|nr:DUF2806 domain-containing protein [Alphaproteobacteria bacterium]